MIWWIRGNSKSGKSTLANKMKDVIVLDGDVLRTIWPGLGLSKEDRWEQNLRAARLAKMIHDQGYDVVVAVICPYLELKEEIKKIIPEVKFATLDGGKEPTNEYPFER
ncbi:MAG: adenylyl-sulfate kinase [Nanoarchaeota archaeon]